MVSVGEYKMQDRWLRYLRCDHSLLGGIWLDPEALHDLSSAASIYKIFHLQEAVRLVERPAFPRQSRALVVGLGIGTVVTGLEGYGVKTTVVEIDPAVSEYARSYFGCPKPSGGILTMDARRFFADNTGEYQYIVHDVFTGGALPIKLFTSEAWKDVKRALAPQGVLAVNVVKSGTSQISGRIVATLLSSFDHCRGFRDTTDPAASAFNMVLFCSGGPVVFRDTEERDFLDSYNRRVILQDFQNREVDLADIALASERNLLTDANAGLVDQTPEIREHWQVMRRTLPDSVWEQY